MLKQKKFVHFLILLIKFIGFNLNLTYKKLKFRIKIIRLTELIKELKN